MDITAPIDVDSSIASLGGNVKLYISMLARLEQMALNMCITQITDSIIEKDWEKLKVATHTLKGASAYVGAGKVHYACFYIQKAYLE